MSVQAGIWSLDGEPVNREFLARISQTIAEYGPDGETTYFDETVGMLYRPLHTTLESRVEHQPHASASGRVFTWDGRLDNRDELILQLRDDLRTDRTDVALVVTAFDRWGTECFTRFIGDWALSIWDPREKELILARDYMGIRHLFYYPKPKRVIWCSHLAPLALCGDQFSLSDEYIAGYLGQWPDAHLTPYREILSVPPAKFARIRNAKVSVHPYWTFNPHLKTRYKTDAEYEEHFRHLFRQAVRRRLRTDGPILADLSGGLDSSSIVCMADDILAKERVQTNCVNTFSFYDREEPEEEDLRYLTKVEEKRGRIGYHAELRSLGETFSLTSESFIPRPGFGVREELRTAHSDAVKQGNYRVILAGHGGDEFLGQAFDPRVQMADLLVQFRIREMAKHLTEWSLLFRRPWIQLLLEAAIFLLPSSLRARTIKITEIEPWIDRRFAWRRRLSSRRLEAAEGKWSWLPSVRDAYQTHNTVARKMTYTMPSAAEQRYPYLDQNLVEFVTSIPTDQLIRPGQRRSLMRRALAGLLPPEILSRQTKARSGRCLAITTRKHWDELESILHSPLSSRLGYLNHDRFQTALMDTKNGHLPLEVRYLLRGLSLELWLREAAARGVISIPPVCAADLKHSRISQLSTAKVQEHRPNFLWTPSPRGEVDSQKERR